MRLLLNISTRSKFIVGFGLMIVFLGVVIGTAYSGIREIRDSEHQLFEREFTTVSDLLQLRSDLNRQRARILEMSLMKQKSDQEAVERDMKSRTDEIDQQLERLSELTKSDGAIASRLGELKGLLAPYRAGRDAEIAMIYEGNIEQAQAQETGPQNQRFEAIRSLALEMGNDAKERAQRAVLLSEQRSQDALRTFAMIGIAAVVAGLAMILFFNRIISIPLRQLSGLANQIADGDLSGTIALKHRTDEVGQLAQAFSRMTENLRKQISALNEGVSVLGASANQISTSTTQLASSAAQTATAVTETTTTVEEVRQTAQLSTQKSKSVSDTAQRMAQISQSGAKSTEQTINGMQRISQQMGLIADNMVRLSEQTQTIGQIVTSVEDLAAQSNILAVNASIEAAKAGEQGKGFSVVAQEVRSLAEQSKQATDQVRSVLNEIQRATNVAVLATEQGSKAVEAGVKQAADAGQSIQLLSSTVIEGSQAATQIAASSQQQLVGVDQVATAMESIKQASGQNLASATQLQTAAMNLKDLGAKLKQTAARYKI